MDGSKLSKQKLIY